MSTKVRKTILGESHRSGRQCRALARPHSIRVQGLTLVEMVIVIVLVGIVFGIGGMLLTQVFRAYFEEQDISGGDWQAKLALERATRELRAIRSATATDFAIPASPSEIRFVDTDGNNVCFYLSGATLMRAENPPTQSCGTTNPQQLADNISSLGFTYWTNTGVATAAVASVYYVTMEVQVARGDYTGSFRATVRPRNF